MGADPAAVAALCGVDERTYLAWERGERRIPEEQRALLADYFGVTEGHLTGQTNGDSNDRTQGRRCA